MRKRGRKTIVFPNFIRFVCYRRSRALPYTCTPTFARTTISALNPFAPRAPFYLPQIFAALDFFENRATIRTTEGKIRVRVGTVGVLRVVKWVNFMDRIYENA